MKYLLLIVPDDGWPSQPGYRVDTEGVTVHRENATRFPTGMAAMETRVPKFPATYHLEAVDE